jgi:multidrug efflux pump subunit AcrB
VVFEAVLKRGLLLTITILVICVLGMVAVLRIPVQMIPDLEVRTITVRTYWPGATPQDVEKEILVEQEEHLRNVPGLQRMISTADTGSARIELEFPFGIDINETLIRVNNALSQVSSYPVSVRQPRIYASSFSSNSFMYFRVAPLPGNPSGVDMDMIRDYVEDHVRTRMERVPGVSQVGVWGGAERQVQIRIDAARLAERGLTLADVRTAVRSRNRDVSGGDIESGKRRYLLRTVGRFDGVESLKELVLNRSGDAITRLGDIAEVRLDHYEIQSKSYVDGKPVLSLSVRRESGSNVIAIKKAMLPVMDEINRAVLEPAGMRLTLNADDVGYVQESIKNVWTNLVIGAVLATLVMFLFMRSVRSTALGVMGIPICTIAAFIGLVLTGRTVNVISLAGVAFAIGMTLDNTIVVLESIALERRRGLERFAAALAGVKRVWPAVLASTLTTILVFAPVLFIREEAGQLYSDIAIAISASILASMFIAITAVPTASARVLPEMKGTVGADGAFRRWALACIEWLMAGSLRRIVVIAATIAVSVLVIVVLTPPAEYLPEGEEPKIFATMSPPPGYNLEEMASVAEEVEAHFLPFVNDDPKRYQAGETMVPAIKYLYLRVEPGRLRIIAEPVDTRDTDSLMDAITDKYREFAGMRAFATRGSIITSNNGGTRAINLDISGPRLDDIYATTLAAYRQAQQVFDRPRLRAAPRTLSLAQPLVEVRPRWARAAEVGLSAEELGFTVAALTDGAYVDEFFLDDEKIDIYLYGAPGGVRDLEDIGQLPVYTPQGAVLPLGSIADVVETVDTDTVRRVDGKRTVTLSIIPPRSVALETGVEMVQRHVVGTLRDQGGIPAGVTIDITGASDQLNATREALTGNYAVAVLLIYLLLVAVFSHWGYPLVIMTTIPLGIASGLVGLWLLNLIGAGLPAFGFAAFHQPFDMISMLGFLILMGVVVNNPILIVDQSVYNVRHQGMSALQAVRGAVETRLRPIAMSSITTICGLSPLVFIPGAGTELYRGLGAIVLFGVAGATIVTLTFLPALTVLVLRIRERRMSGLRHGGKAAAAPGD